MDSEKMEEEMKRLKKMIEHLQDENMERRREIYSLNQKIGKLEYRLSLHSSDLGGILSRF